MSYSEQCEKIIDAACTFGPVSNETIANAEAELGVAFPSPYRTFLARYGAAMGVGFEIAGLFKSDKDEPPMWRDIVLATKRTRRAARGHLPETLLPISGDGASLTYYINANGEDSCPVVAYGPGCDGQQVAESFEEFVVKLSTDRL